MDRSGIHQAPEGSREQGKMEETGCDIICGASMTLAAKGYIWWWWAVICHLHFWQNDWDLLYASATTQEWNGHQNRSQQRKFTNWRASSNKSGDLPLSCSLPKATLVSKYGLFVDKWSADHIYHNVLPHSLQSMYLSIVSWSSIPSSQRTFFFLAIAVWYFRMSDFGLNLFWSIEV